MRLEDDGASWRGCWGHVEESIQDYPMMDGDFSREVIVTSSVLSLTRELWLQCGAVIISPGCTSQ